MKKIGLAIIGIAVLVACFMTVPTNADDVGVNTTVNTYITAVFNYNTVAYGSLSAGTSNNVAPNQASGVYNISMDTNANYKVQSSGTTFGDGAGHTFNVNNLKMDTATTAGGLALGSAIALSGTPQIIDTGYTPSDTMNFNGYWLTIPASQFAGVYNATITVAVSSV